MLSNPSRKDRYTLRVVVRVMVGHRPGDIARCAEVRCTMLCFVEELLVGRGDEMGKQEEPKMAGNFVDSSGWNKIYMWLAHENNVCKCKR